MVAFVSGASGYLGSRLIPELLDRGHPVTAGLRDPDRADRYSWADRVDAVAFDITDPETVRDALAGCTIAYYLVHSMAGPDFRRKDAEGAERFAQACAEAQVRQVVYVSGLVPNGELSDHLASRLEVERILLGGAVPALVLRAAVIVGAGSTSFELIRRLVERLPVIPVPAWMHCQVQPVAAEDVVSTLADLADAVARGEIRRGHHDLGGPDRLDYPDLIALVAEELELPRPQLPFPAIPQALAGHAAALLTGIPRSTVVELFKSLRHDMVCEPDAVLGTLPVAEAVRRALAEEHTGTAARGDRQTMADSDPEWVGGTVEVDPSGVRRHRHRSAVGQAVFVASAAVGLGVIVGTTAARSARRLQRRMTTFNALVSAALPKVS
ncbi:NAD(P)H-binding protein [Nocardioides sp.]|uniref:NAD(P)H-binding protein n=1 Tax=Nocardioides sp. TaxID=35761 RepID=UPI0039E4746F